METITEIQPREVAKARRDLLNDLEARERTLQANLLPIERELVAAAKALEEARRAVGEAMGRLTRAEAAGPAAVSVFNRHRAEALQRLRATAPACCDQAVESLRQMLCETENTLIGRGYSDQRQWHLEQRARILRNLINEGFDQIRITSVTEEDARAAIQKILEAVPTA